MIELLSNSKPFLFKNIFPDYESFDTFITEMEIRTPSIEADAYLRRIYRILFNNFANSTIKFSTINDFKGCFANVLDEWLLPYNIQVDKITQILQMSSDDILKVNESLDSFSNAPNEEGVLGSSQLNYISAQNYRVNKGDKLYRLLDLMDRLPSYRVGEFINRFRWLFKTVIPQDEYIFTEVK